MGFSQVRYSVFSILSENFPQVDSRPILGHCDLSPTPEHNICFISNLLSLSSCVHSILKHTVSQYSWADWLNSEDTLALSEGLGSKDLHGSLPTYVCHITGSQRKQPLTGQNVCLKYKLTFESVKCIYALLSESLWVGKEGSICNMKSCYSITTIDHLQNKETVIMLLFLFWSSAVTVR